MSTAAIPVSLSSASVYPLAVSEAFAIAAELGFDGVEVMVTHNRVSQNGHALLTLSQRYEMPIHAIHAPTLLLTQQVWGSAWNKVERSVDLAAQVGADVVVVHPPFRWQGDYAQSFAHGVRDLSHNTGVAVAVENMYPWRVRGREGMAYLPHWDPVGQDYEDVTWDLSHAATAGASSLESIKALGRRLRHVHLTDGLGANKDEHLMPGEGNQQAALVLQHLAASNFGGAVVLEISTRKAKGVYERESMLQRSLAFAREHLGQLPT